MCAVPYTLDNTDLVKPTCPKRKARPRRGTLTGGVVPYSYLALGAPFSGRMSSFSLMNALSALCSSPWSSRIHCDL